MRKAIKKIAVILVVVCLSTVFTACNSETNDSKVAVKIGNAEVKSDVFAYYLDVVLQDSDESLTEEDAIKKAENLCAEYVKINTEFSSKKLSLSSSSKASAASKVNDLWSIYGGYYDDIGVSKQTLTKIKESEAYKQALISDRYGVGGEKEITEEHQKEYFSSNHVFFKAISSFLYITNDAGDVVKLSASELEELKNKFDSMKAQITGDTTIDSVNKAYEESNGGTAESEMPVLSTTKDAGLYPDGFFAAISKMENGALEVLTYDTYYFLVQKKNADDYFKDYQSENLLEMASEDFMKSINSQYADLGIDGDIGVQKDCYRNITRIKESK